MRPASREIPFLHTMSAAQLRQMPRAEKLQLLEDLWADLSKGPDDLPCPQWHEDELNKTAEAYAAGRIESLSLDQAWVELESRCQ